MTDNTDSLIFAGFERELERMASFPNFPSKSATEKALNLVRDIARLPTIYGKGPAVYRYNKMRLKAKKMAKELAQSETFGLEG